MNISKYDAAARQLDVAIELLFEDREILAVFTIGNAASVIFADLVEAKNPGMSWDRRGSKANGLALNEWFAAIRRAPNFLKHARNDPDAYLEIDTQDIDRILFIACLNHGSLLQSGERISVTQSVFQLWYLSRNAEQLLNSDHGERLGPLIAEAIAVLGELPADRTQAIAAGKTFLRHQSHE